MFLTKTILLRINVIKKTDNIKIENVLKILETNSLLSSCIDKIGVTKKAVVPARNNNKKDIKYKISAARSTEKKKGASTLSKSVLNE